MRLKKPRIIIAAYSCFVKLLFKKTLIKPTFPYKYEAHPQLVFKTSSPSRKNNLTFLHFNLSFDKIGVVSYNVFLHNLQEAAYGCYC